MDGALYTQVYEGLRARIESGDVAVGDKLPTQHELADEFHVSVITVKHALALLQEAGYIERRPRIGSVVVSAVPTTSARHTLPTMRPGMRGHGHTSAPFCWYIANDSRLRPWTLSWGGE